MCLAGASFTVGATWSWRSSLEGSQVAGCALPRIHGTHIYIAALIAHRDTPRYQCLAAHPANYGKGILNHRRCFAFSKHQRVLCAHDISGTLLEVSSDMHYINYTATAARDANSSARIGKRAIKRVMSFFFSENEIAQYAKNRKTLRRKERVLYLVRYRNKMFKRWRHSFESIAVAVFIN